MITELRWNCGILEACDGHNWFPILNQNGHAPIFDSVGFMIVTTPEEGRK